MERRAAGATSLFVSDFRVEDHVYAPFPADPAAHAGAGRQRRGAQDARAPGSGNGAAPAAGQQPAVQPANGQEGLVVDVEGGISTPMPIAIPAMPTSAVVQTPAGTTDVVGQKLSEIIANDLRNSGLFTPIPPAQLRTVSFPEVTAPAFDY